MASSAKMTRKAGNGSKPIVLLRSLLSNRWPPAIMRKTVFFASNTVGMSIYTVKLSPFARIYVESVKNQPLSNRVTALRLSVLET